MSRRRSTCTHTQTATPEKCDDQLSKVLVQLEEVEGRFGEFDEFLADLTSRREEILTAYRETGGHRGKMAEVLGISRATLYRRLKKHGLL